MTFQCSNFHFKSLFLWYNHYSTVQFSFSLASCPFPLNLVLSAVKGGPLFTRQWIDFWFPRGAHAAVMFYSGAIQGPLR